MMSLTLTGANLSLVLKVNLLKSFILWQVNYYVNSDDSCLTFSLITFRCFVIVLTLLVRADAPAVGLMLENAFHLEVQSNR